MGQTGPQEDVRVEERVGAQRDPLAARLLLARPLTEHHPQGAARSVLDVLHGRVREQGHSRVRVEMGELVEHGELRVDRTEVADAGGAAGWAVGRGTSGPRAGHGEEPALVPLLQEPVRIAQPVRGLRVGSRAGEGAVARPRDGHDLLGLLVEGFELVVLERPIGSHAVGRAQAKVVGQEARCAPPPAVRASAEDRRVEPRLPRPVGERALAQARHLLAVGQLPGVGTAGTTLEHQDARLGCGPLQVAMKEERGREPGAYENEVIRLFRHGPASRSPRKGF